MTVVSLVNKATADEEVKESVIRLLRETLEQAEAGEVDSILMIVGSPSGEWLDKASETVKFSETIGRLEISKQEWINRYLRDH